MQAAGVKMQWSSSTLLRWWWKVCFTTGKDCFTTGKDYFPAGKDCSTTGIDCFTGGIATFISVVCNIFLPSSSKNPQWRQCVCGCAVSYRSVPPSVNLISLYLDEGFQWKLTQNCLLCELALRKRFARSEIKGQGHAVVACILTAWRWRWHILNIDLLISSLRLIQH